MLSALFGSGSREKILNYFLLSSEENIALKRATKELGIGSAALRRELAGLQNLGLIKIDAESISVRRDFLLYPEIKALFAKAQILSSQNFIDELKKICQPRLLALTGTFTNHQESLTDILLVGKVRKPAFIKLISGLEKNLGKEINFTIMDEREFYYRRSIMDIFLSNILNGTTVMLINELEK